VSDTGYDEIDVTPEMAAAGAVTFWGHPYADISLGVSEAEVEVMLCDVFRAMLRAQRKSDVEGLSPGSAAPEYQ
jgi:hypothetical protein